MFLTDFGENAIADKLRGTEPPYEASWWIAFGTFADDGTFTEIVDVGMPRVPVARSLAKWAGTQGAGTTVASNGTSHITSNNDDIDFGASAADHTAVAVGLFDALTGGNCWAYAPIADRAIATGVPASIASGALAFEFGGANVADYLSNKMIDEFFRDQAYPWPASIFGALYTAMPTTAGGGTEVGGGVGYARVELESTMAALSGTQGAGSTDPSSGTGGEISNNETLAYPSPAGTWGDLVGEGWLDAATTGNLLLLGEFASPQTIGATTPAVAHAPATLTIRLTKAAS